MSEKPFKTTFNPADPKEYIELYERHKMPPLIITVAITGGLQGKEANLNIPETPEEQAQATLEAYEAGASIVHVHARDPNFGYGRASGDPEIYRDINKRIRKLCPDIIINNTTGGGWGLTIEDRIKAIDAGPEMCSLNMGSLSTRGVIKARKPPLSGRDEDIFFDGIFENKVGDIERIAKTMMDKGIKPEMETFTDGHISNIHLLVNKGLIKPPYFIQYVQGFPNGTQPTPMNLLVQMANAPQPAMFNVLGVGVHELPLNTFGILLGQHVRVGMEDNVYYKRGEKAKSNAQLVERIVRIANELNRPIATPGEAREMLGMSKAPSSY